MTKDGFGPRLALVTLAALIVAIPYGVAGMAVATALSQLANIVLLGVAERHVLRRRILSEVPA